MRALELKPLVVAAAIGALALWALHSCPAGRRNSDFAKGAAVGVAVQLGVRLARVS